VTLSDRYWVLVVLRAVPAAAIALLITFTSEHSATLGFLSLGGFSVVTGALVLAGSLRLFPSGTSRALFAAGGIIWLLGGVLLLVLANGSLADFLLLASILLAVTGVLELVAGLRARRTAAYARDWIFVGGVTAVLALVLAFIPADFVEVIESTDNVVPPLTASTIAVGALGAWAAIVAVYLVIAGLSLKWSTTSSETVQA
jgi:hypothetical protein